MIGKVLSDRYKITAPLGEGGVGETFLAIDTQRPGDPQCVVKRLKTERSLNHSSSSSYLENAQRLFKSEAQTLEDLGRHDQIPQLLAYIYSEADKEFYLVQEFIDGHLLSVELPPGKAWAEKKVIPLLQDVLGILDFVHGKRVIHRDVKPTNLIRRYSDRKLVLIDFGAVKVKLAPQIYTKTLGSGTISIGTEGYMPPEQAMGHPSFRSDLYALGMIGIQALMGISPAELKRDEDGEIIWYHQGKASDQLAEILTKLVRFRSKERYPSAAEAIAALQALLDDRPGAVPIVAAQGSPPAPVQELEATKVAPPLAVESEPIAVPKETQIAAMADPIAMPKETQIAVIAEPIAVPKETQIASVPEPVAPSYQPQENIQETKVVAKLEPPVESISSGTNDAQFKVVQDVAEAVIPSAVTRTTDSETRMAAPAVNRELPVTRMAEDRIRQPPGLAETKMGNAVLPLRQSRSSLPETRMAAVLDDAVEPSSEPTRYPWKMIVAGVAIVGVGILGILGANSFGRISNFQSHTPEGVPEPLEPILDNSKPKLKGDYTQLETYLKQRDWEAADHETYEVMLKVAGPISEEQGSLDLEEGESFPCGDLQKIDTLWSQASLGRLGFSKQKEIFASVKEKGDKYLEKIQWATSEGTLKIGWKENEHKRIDYKPNQEPNFQEPIAPGHLPAKLIWKDKRLRMIGMHCNF
jgi:serine/threonine protein kinase